MSFDRKVRRRRGESGDMVTLESLTITGEEFLRRIGQMQFDKMPLYSIEKKKS